MKLNLYCIEVVETRKGRVWIKANTPEEAKAEVEQHLEMQELDESHDFPYEWEYDELSYSGYVEFVETIMTLKQLGDREPSDDKTKQI